MEDYRRAMQRSSRVSPIAWWGIALGMAWHPHRGWLLGSFGTGSDLRLIGVALLVTGLMGTYRSRIWPRIRTSIKWV